MFSTIQNIEVSWYLELGSRYTHFKTYKHLISAHRGQMPEIKKNNQIKLSP